MTNIIDITDKLKQRRSPDADDFFSSIIYRNDLLDMIDTILDDHTKGLDQIAKEHGDISDNDLNETIAILGFVDRIYEELAKDPS